MTSGTRKPQFKQRRVRLMLPLVSGYLSGSLVKFVDMSVTGAGMVTDFQPELGSVQTVTLLYRLDQIDFRARIVRCVKNASNDPSIMAAGPFRVGIEFLGLTPADQKLISALCGGWLGRN